MNKAGMSEWKTYKLGEICTDISYGYTESASSEMVGPKFLRITDIQHDFINWNNVPYCPITETNHNKYKLEVGDIVIARTGASTGTTAIFKDADIDAVYASYLIRYKIDKSKADPFYIGHLLKSPLWKQHVNSIIGGSGQPGANAKQFASFKIEIPDLPTQRQIAQILSSLDDKIELNLQMNQTLEAMAQAIFKEWFVNFNFLGFDGELVDGLPKGWRIVELSSLISVKDGTHDSPKQQQEGKYLITSKHLKNHFIDFSSAYKISDDDFNKVNKRSKVDRLDILITMIGTVGNLYFVHENEIDFAIKNIGLFKASERPDLAYFLYFTIDSKETSEYFTKRLAGSTQQYLTLETLRQTPVLLPDYETLNAFNEYARTIYERIDINSQNIQSLTQTRDTLLPKLMSGQLEVV